MLTLIFNAILAERGTYSNSLWKGKPHRRLAGPRKLPTNVSVPLTLGSIGTTIWSAGRLITGIKTALLRLPPRLSIILFLILISITHHSSSNNRLIVYTVVFVSDFDFNNSSVI
jgi:hypothetical protein